MSKQSSSGEQNPASICRSSKSDEVVRNLLYCLAEYIGPQTLELVLYLCPDNITEDDSIGLDDLISCSSRSIHKQIEEAASIVLRQQNICFKSFQSTLKSLL
jgi:hypothetical protein